MADATATTVNGSQQATAEPTSEIGRQLADLRALAAESPTEARDQVWAWFETLGKEAGDDREGGTAKLNELFRSGAPPREIDGRTEGILVAPLIFGPVDRVLRTLTGAWMPWLGKRFDREAAKGDNVLRNDVRWPAKLFWPLYGTGSLGDARSAFDFETRVEPGEDDPDIDVLVIDYAPVDSNPRFIIRSIRDELVEIVPGANLGKVLWRNRDGSHSLIGFFALRTEV
jgi:hypothetical protein